MTIRSDQVRPSTLLAKLSAFPRQNGLALALRDLGRINRSIFLPQWWQNPEMRRNATAGLNKSEAQNTLVRALFYNRLGELRDRTFESQFYRAPGDPAPVCTRRNDASDLQGAERTRPNSQLRADQARYQT